MNVERGEGDLAALFLFVGKGKKNQALGCYFIFKNSVYKGIIG